MLFYSERLTIHQTTGLSGATIGLMFTSLFVILHSVVYEWQAMYWVALAKISFLKPIVNSRYWMVLFPLHLNKKGRDETRALSKFPASTIPPKVDGYPRLYYERGIEKNGDKKGHREYGEYGASKREAVASSIQKSAQILALDGSADAHLQNTTRLHRKSPEAIGGRLSHVADIP